MKMRKRWFFILVLGLLSCEGKFDPVNQLGLFSLEFPIENEPCQEGTFISDSEIRIPFLWTISENATSYEIEIREVVSDMVVDVSSEITETNIDLILQPGTMYQWRIIATDGVNERATDSQSFYSSGLPQENYVPFPAEIDVIDNLDGTATIEWEGNDIDSDIVSYTVSFGTTNPPTQIEEDFTGNSLQVTIQSGQIYYVLIRTIDQNGNYSDSFDFFEF